MIEIPFLFKLSVILVISLIISLILNLIRQPLIIGYILTGVLVSSYLISSLETKSIVSIFAELGVAFMLFIVGLELKLKIIKEVGRQSIIIGTLQEIFTILIGFLLSLLLGFNYIEALYLGIALSFSSTIIMIKLISDKGDLEKLYGKLAIGFLIVQDLVAILLLIIFPLLPIGEKIINTDNLIISLILVILIPLLSFLFFPLIEKLVVRSKEVIFLFSISFLLLIASIFKILGLGLEVGALIAGMTLANMSFSSEIKFRLKPLKDFFLIIFFIYLGFNIFIPKISNYLLPVIIFSLFVIFGKPMIMYILLKLIKINHKTSFRLGLTSGQISEFSFIFIALGNKLGYLGNGFLSLISLIGLITIFVSTYLVYHSENIFNFIFRRLFKIKDKYNIDDNLLKNDYDILLIGCDRTGYSFLANFEELKNKILIIEYNYDKFKKLLKQDYKIIYADASEIDLWDEIRLDKFKLIFSTIPEFEINIFILENYKKLNPRGIFICNSSNYFHTIELYKKGADYVNMYHFLGGEKISKLIKEFGFQNENYELVKKEDSEKIKNIINYLSN